MNLRPDNRWRDALLSAVAFTVAAIICFVLPNCTAFGVVLVILGATYTIGLATGMEPNADPTATWHHLRSSLRRLAPQPSGIGIGPYPPPPPPVGYFGLNPAAPPAIPTSPPPATAAPPGPATHPQPAPVAPPQMSPEPVIAPPPGVPEAAPIPATLPPAAPMGITTPDTPTGPFAAPPAGHFGPPVTVAPWTGPVQLPPPPAPRIRRRTMLLGVIALVTVAVVAASAVTAVLLSRDNDHKRSGTTYASGMLHSSYPTVPSAAFGISPGQLGAEGFYRPNYLVGGEENTGFLRSDRYIITGLGNGALAAFDPTDGHTVWTQKSYSGLNCSHVFDDQTIGCDTAANGLVLLSADTGKVIAQLPQGYSRVLKFGDKYAYSRTDNGSVTVSLGTRTDATAYWTHTNTVSGGSRSRLVVSKKLISFQDGSASGGWAYTYNEAGNSVGTTGTFGTLLGADAFADQPGDSVVVKDSENRLRYLTTAYPIQPDLYAPGPGMSIAFTRTDAIDPDTGTALWQRPASTVPDSTSSGVGDIVAVVGTVAVIRSDSTEPAVGIDIRTGKVLWTSDINVYGYNLTTDGQRLISIDHDNTVVALDLATGRPAWTVSVPDVGEYPKVVAVGSDLAVVGSAAIVGFHPTGGAATLYDGSTGTPGGRSGSAGSVTACSTPATVTPENFSVSEGSLLVRLKFIAGCAGGDVLSNSQYTVTISDQASAIASSNFDLSSTPIAVPRDRGTVSRDFAFPSGTFWRLPSSLSGGSGSSTSVAASGQTVECNGRGSNSVADGQQVTPSADSATTPLAGTQPAAGSSDPVDTDANAINALRAQADADRPLVTRDYANRWVAQISAKQIRSPGMRATDVDDRTMVVWTPAAILRQHLMLRSRYPEVRLIYSNDWRTFDLRDWWITVAQPDVLDAPGANFWCDSKRIAPNQCFAKLVSNDRGSEGTTVYRR